MSRSFNQQFDQHGAWRRNFAHRLKWLASWLRENDLMDQSVSDRMRELEAQMRTSKVMVAFVAEFSRGKSELINAIFFAGYGRRIMPASAGRTTMCPTELGYDAAYLPGLRLLPIETRLEPHSLTHWRDQPERWTEVPVDVQDAESLSAAMHKVAEVDWVPVERARALGFWSDETPQDNPMVDAEGRVEVPRWRHALLNMPHPLLEQGLVILDTPGLNAIGAEPELTVSLIPQAHAVVFILGADTGVTRSDLAIWREHLVTEGDPGETRIVVLNKIDTLWDTLSAPGQIDAQIERQCTLSADTLGVPRERVLPVSAQKGLQAKIAKDAALLQGSRLPALEAALGDGLLGRRETMLRLAVEAGVSALRAEASRILSVRERDLSEQALELQGLRGKNSSVIRHMRSRIEQEQSEFESSNTRILALRSVQGKLLREVYAVLGSTALKSDLARLAATLKRPGIKLSVRKVYGATFDVLRSNLREVQATTSEIQAMLHATFRQLNAEHGFSLQAPAEPDLSGFVAELDGIERSHLHYLGVGNLLKLAQGDFCDRLVRALGSRVRTVNEAAMTEVERWSKAAGAQLDAQLKERRRNFVRRIESVERIQTAAGGLDERLGEIRSQEQELQLLNERLQELTVLLTSQEPIPPAVPGAPRGELRAA
ncbi:dynamin family protein [Xenophilus aerolatus]|nr:dynamin family protein [Xenophilus aerolatus]